MQFFVKKEDVLGAHHEYEQMLYLNNFKIKLFVCKTYLDMQFSGFQNEENETNRSLTMPTLQVQKRSETTAWVSHVNRKMQITSKARSISTNEINEGFAVTAGTCTRRAVFSCIGALVAGFYLLFLPGPIVNPESEINGVSWVWKQQPVASKAKVTTKIRKTKRASKDMLLFHFWLVPSRLSWERREARGVMGRRKGEGGIGALACVCARCSSQDPQYLKVWEL